MWVLPTSQSLPCRTSADGSHALGQCMAALCKSSVWFHPLLTSNHSWALWGWTGTTGGTEAGNYFCPILVCLLLRTHSSWKLSCSLNVTCEILAPIIPVSNVFAPLLSPVFTRQRKGSAWRFTQLLHTACMVVNGFATSGFHRCLA